MPTPIAAPQKVVPSAPASPTCDASNYYRLCEFYLRVDSTNDSEVREVGQLSVDSFAHAAQLMSSASQPVRFPYEDTALPWWWIPAERLCSSHRR